MTGSWTVVVYNWVRTSQRIPATPVDIYVIAAYDKALMLVSYDKDNNLTSKQPKITRFVQEKKLSVAAISDCITYEIRHDI